MPIRRRPDLSEITDIYIDESSQSAHRYLVLGGIRIKKLDMDHFNGLMARARLPELPFGEAKWTKVSRSKLDAYKRIVDIVFGTGDLIHFHSLIVDTSRLDHATFNQGSRDIGFNKEVFQLALKFAKLYPETLFHVYPDQRRTSQSPEELRLMLNRKCASNGDERDWPFRRCQFRDSKLTPALQLVDLLIGAIAWDANAHARSPNASPAKTELSDHILGCAGIIGALGGTSRTGRFTIWVRKLQNASRSPRSLGPPP